MLEDCFQDLTDQIFFLVIFGTSADALDFLEIRFHLMTNEGRKALTSMSFIVQDYEFAFVGFLLVWQFPASELVLLVCRQTNDSASPPFFSLDRDLMCCSGCAARLLELWHTNITAHSQPPHLHHNHLGENQHVLALLQLVLYSTGRTGQNWDKSQLILDLPFYRLPRRYDSIFLPVDEVSTGSIPQLASPPNPGRSHGPESTSLSGEEKSCGG